MTSSTDRIYKTQLRSAKIVSKIEPKIIEQIAEAGYDGVECTDTSLSLAEAREARRICELNGIRIHSVMRGAQFNNAERVEADTEALRNAIRVAAAYGASTVLCVPGSAPAPNLKPENFRISFNQETLEVTSVCEGDNTPHAEYIDAQNHATRCAQKGLPKVLDVAAYEGVRICLENVWNNLWCDPALLNAFIRSFASPWVGSYFDLGNFVKYQPTENWLIALGKGIIFKLHFKDFLVDHSLPNSGTFVPVGHGSNDWVKIRGILEDLEYNGFVTIEFEESASTKLSDKQQVQKFHNFFAGVDILKGVE